MWERVDYCQCSLTIPLNPSLTLAFCHGKTIPWWWLLLKRNKYVGILSIAVTTLQYITISMITIFSMYITHVRLGSGCNSYQGHVNDSGEFWNFCANGHGWTIGTSFPYIRTSKRQYSTPVQYTCISSCLSWLHFALQALLSLKPYIR